MAKYINIPFKVLENKNLPANAKLLLGYIISLEKGGKCYASNRHFAEVLGVGKIRISQLIKTLVDAKLLSVKIKRDSNGQITERVLKINIRGIKENANRGIIKNAKVIDTIIDTKNNNYIDTYNNNSETSDLVLACYESVVKLFPEKFRPNSDADKLKWIQTIERLNRLDGYNPRQVYYITEQTLQDDFWRTNFYTIHKLRKKNKEGIKYVDIFASRFAKDMVV